MDGSEVFDINKTDTCQDGECLVLAFGHGNKSRRYNWSLFRHITSLQGWSRISCNLTQVNVSGNALTSLGDLSSLSSLVELNCARNKLTSLGFLSSLVSLEVLKCSQNELASLGDLSMLTSLRHLKCYRNRLNEFQGLSALTTLEDLICYENSLEHALTGLEHLHRLRELNCQSNGLTSLDGMPPSVQILKCSRNALRYLPDLHANKSIFYIDTSENRHLPADVSVTKWVNNDPADFTDFLQKTTHDKWRWHCRSTAVVVLAVAETRRNIRDVLGLIAKAAWEEMGREKRFFTQ